MVVWGIAFYCPVKHISQDHRIPRVGWDLWRSFDPTALTSQGHTWQVTQGHVQGGLQCVQRGRPHTTLGSLFQCSTTLSGKFSMSGCCTQHHSSLHPKSTGQRCCSLIKESQDSLLTGVLRVWAKTAQS